MRDRLVWVKPENYYLACACLLFIPLKILIFWLVSVLIHEFFHFIVIRLFGKSVLQVSIGFSGIKMRTEPLNPWQEILCALAGPIGGIMLFFLFLRHEPLLAIFALLHSAYNLIPLFPLDGGRVLHGLLEVIFRYKNYTRAVTIADTAVACVLLIVSVVCVIGLRLGLLPLLIVILIIIKNKKIHLKCLSNLSTMYVSD